MNANLQTPAQATDAEVSLLGAAMSGYRDLPELVDYVKASDFYHPSHGQVWDAIVGLVAAGTQPDPVSVRVALDHAGVRHDPTRLVDMCGLVPLVAQAAFYAEQVVSAAGHRAIQAAGVRLQQIGCTPGDLPAHREQAQQVVDDATTGREKVTVKSMGKVITDVIDAAQEGDTVLLPTGWPDVDRLLGGLAPGRLVVVGARPGVGKSLLGTNLALHFAEVHKRGVLISSLEMPEREVGQRLLAAHARVSLSALQDGTLDEPSWSRVADSYGILADLPITVDDAAEQSVVGIQRAARQARRTHGDLAVIVVDYLQLIQPVSRSGNRAEDLGTISRALKLLARDTGACVVAMVQVNREGTRHSDGRPRMTDIRESGSIEADADQVLLLHQPDDRVPEIEVIVDKNRHRQRGIARLHLQGHYARLLSVQWDPSAAAR